MNKNIIFAVIGLVILGGGYLLLKGGYQNPNSSVRQNTSQVSQTPNTIVAQNFAFSPQVLTVQAGTKVTWTNQDPIPHDITSAPGEMFKSDPLDQNQSFSFTYDKVGECDYQCAIHPSMTGKIIVQ